MMDVSTAQLKRLVEDMDTIVLINGKATVCKLDKCENCGTTIQMVNSFSVNQEGFDYLVKDLKFKVVETSYPYAEPTCNDEGEEFCDECHHLHNK